MLYNSDFFCILHKNTTKFWPQLCWQKKSVFSVICKIIMQKAKKLPSRKQKTKKNHIKCYWCGCLQFNFLLEIYFLRSVVLMTWQMCCYNVSPAGCTWALLQCWTEKETVVQSASWAWPALQGPLYPIMEEWRRFAHSGVEIIIMSFLIWTFIIHYSI